MGATTSVVKATVPTLNHAIVIAEVTFSASYATGGDSVAAADLGLSSIDYIVVGGCDDARYHGWWDQANRVITLYLEDATTGIEAQVVAATDVSTVRCQVIAIGKE